MKKNRVLTIKKHRHMKKVSFSKIVALLLFCLLQTVVFAQERQIAGKVSDAGGFGLPGVSIQIKGTTMGTITDMDGNFSLSAASDAVLIFSFVGYISQEIVVGEQTEINIILNEDIMELDEIVVVGYGTSKKSDLTGAMASLGEDEFNKAGAGTPQQMIQGRVAGVSVVSNNGEPGAGSQIKVRGASTIRSGQQPLFVIDGIPLDMQTTSPDGIEGGSLGGAPASNPLTFLNPNDIEKIDIMKDASAAAIYGSRGANGVILITTKKGTEGQSFIEYSSSVSLSHLPKQLPVLTAEEWADYREDTLGTTDYDYRDDEYNPFGTNWQDQIFREAISHQHNLALSGGTANTSYRVSFGYGNEQGIIKKSDLERYTGRLNLTQRGLHDHLTMEATLLGSYVLQNRPPVGATGFEGDLLLSALQSNPTWPVYDTNGIIFQTGVSGERNPVAMLEYTDDLTKTSRIVGGLAATVDLLKGLSYKISTGFDYTNANRFINQSQRLSYQALSNGRGDINNKELYNFLIEHTLNYNKAFGVHKIAMLLGYSYQTFELRGSKMSAGGYPTDEIFYTDRIHAGTRDYDVISSWADQYKIQSFFGRFNYNFNEKLLLTGTVRADGSSKFGENKKYGIFPSFAAAYRLSQEEFIRNIGIISNLKLRAGWGQTGNSEIGTKRSRYLFSPDAQSRALIGVNQEEIIGLQISRTPNPDITWESTTSANFGLDFGFFEGRLSGSIDLYQKSTKDLILEIPTPAGSPTATVVQNIDSCRIINSGIEMMLGGVVLTGNFLGWDINGSMTFNSNVVKDLPVDQYQTGSAQGQGLTGEYAQIITSDQPMNVFYGFVIDSVSSIGRVYYATDSSGIAERRYLGQPQPRFTWSLTNTFTLKGFDLSIFVEGVHGHQIFNNTALLLDKNNLVQAKNAQPVFVYDEIDAVRYAPRVSDRYVEDGDYIRLSNVTLGYNIPIKNSWVKTLRLYISGSNLGIITNYTGYDPDVSSTKDMNNINSFGIDNTNYPKARTYMCGLNASF
jgi:TonB-dependent starch-binding outer membrane protein SusC